jgi:hypothetical protein
MQQKKNIVPIGGMNSDLDPRYFEDGDYLEAYNLMIGDPQEEGSEGLVQSIISTLKISMDEVVSGDDDSYEYLDVIVDPSKSRAYILVLVITGSHGNYFTIFKHDIKAGTQKIIYYGNASAWGIEDVTGRDQAHFYNSKMVNNNIIWTDNVNNIRMINVERLETTWDAGIRDVITAWTEDNSGSFVSGDFCYYNDRIYYLLSDADPGVEPPDDTDMYEDKAAIIDVYLDMSNLDTFILVAAPPLIAPTVSYTSTASRNVNQLRGMTWQFSYRYVYMDYRKSTFAPPSIIPAPSQEENTEGEPTQDQTRNNAIQIIINSGGSEVRQVQIIARNSSDPATWFLIKNIDIITEGGYRQNEPNVSIAFNFYNDKLSQVVNSTDVYTLFSYVPIKAKHMEVISGNQLVFANITEGYSKENTNVTVSLSYTDLSGITNNIVSLSADGIFGGSVLAGYSTVVYLFTLPYDNPGECIFSIRRYKLGEPGTTVTYSYNGTDPYPATVKTGLKDALIAEFGTDVIQPYPVGVVSSNYNFVAFYEIKYGFGLFDYFCQFSYTTTEVLLVDKYPVLKSGVTQSWGIIYRDLAGRMSPVMGSGEIVKYIPYVTENTSSNAASIPNVTFELNHTPPEWADSYEIVYAGNKSISWFLDLLGYNYSYGKIDHDDVDSIDTDHTTGRVRVSTMQSYTRNKITNWSVETYVWEKGDRMRIIGAVADNGVLTEINGTLYDTEITGVFTDTDTASIIGDLGGDAEVQHEWIYFKILGSTGSATGIPTPGLNQNLLFQIYRPYKESVDDVGLFFTTGMTFEIGTDVYGNKYHKGDTNQVLTASGIPSTPAIVNNTSHDAWKYLRNFVIKDQVSIINEWVESELASDFTDVQKMTSQGLPIPDIDSQQQNVMTKRLRHGGQLSIGTQTNLLADFEFDKYEDLKDEHGDIEGCRLVGFTLKVIQFDKVTSIYINRKEAYSADGSSQYLFTDKVFGTVRPGSENYGTAHPGSVLVHNRHLYFWDQSEGMVIRDAPNGIIPISDYKMVKHFQEQAKTLDAVADPKNQFVEFTYSKELEQLFCVFGTGDNKVITTFSEKGQRWKVHLETKLALGKFYFLGKRIFHLNEGVIHEWFKGSDYQDIGGDTTSVGKITFFVVMDPAKPFTYDSLIAYMKGAAPQFGYVKIPKKAMAIDGYPSTEMETDIFVNNIYNREGVYYCQILRDKNSPGTQTENWKLVNGKRLRGLYAEVELIFNSTAGDVTLSNIIAVGTPSERSK